VSDPPQTKPGPIAVRCQAHQATKQTLVYLGKDADALVIVAVVVVVVGSMRCNT